MQLGHDRTSKCLVQLAIAGMEQQHVHQLTCCMCHMQVLTKAHNVFAWGCNKHWQLDFSAASKAYSTLLQVVPSLTSLPFLSSASLLLSPQWQLPPWCWQWVGEGCRGQECVGGATPGEM